MSSFQAVQPFRFLDLPGEIRNSVYDLLLCSWDAQPEQDLSLVSKLSRRCPSYSAAALLRTNKQIHNEASDYMIKRNQFVRITCRGFDVRSLLLGGETPVITTDAQQASQFSGYLMHMTLSKPAFSPSVYQFEDYEIMMLRSDLPQLCSQLDVESVMADANSTTKEHCSLQAQIKLNYAYTRSSSTKIQEHLLNPIATLLRGVPNVQIVGPVDAALSQAVVDDVARPRWTDPEATLEEIGTGVDVGKRQWQQNNFYGAAESWAYAMRTLERMRHSSSWFGLQQAGGEDFVNKTADLYFTLNLFHAQFLQLDMATHHGHELLIQRNGQLALQHLHKCETASARFAQHAGATWTPSNLQSAKMLFRQARCIRLMHDSANRVKALTLIEQAVTLAPNEMGIRDEKGVILGWFVEVENTLRSMAEEQNQPVLLESPNTLWSTVWTALVELAA